jgi:3'-phosphoadenosine 5'-phosphosulfate sulfotransferase (PAPS reductase)/FAD synthetase
MLWHIIEAFDGKLPADVHVTFANTGKEREETLRFVHECASRWGVHVHWIEWRRRERRELWENGFIEVGYNSASRNGEPFAALIAHKKYTPNCVTRFCTSELKIRVMRYFMQARGYVNWTNVIGLRGDEMHRVFKAIERSESGKEPWRNAMPMAQRAAGPVRQQDVLNFWARQPFDLGLRPYEGNCDLCFLKSRAKKKAIIRDDPSRAEWWGRMETTAGGRFTTEYSYADLVREVAASPLLPLEDGDDEEFDAECGLWCPGEAA